MLMKAVSDLETRNKVTVTAVCVGITGNHIHGDVQNRRHAIHSEHGVVDEDDLLDMQDEFDLVPVPPKCVALHIEPRRYTLDNKHEVPNPLGQRTSLLEVELLSTLCDSSVVDTLANLVAEALGGEPEHFAFNGLVNAQAVLDDNDRKSGALVIDLGDGVTEYCLYYGDNCFYAGQKIIGCQHIANDLALGLDLSYAKAKSLLKEHVSAISKVESRNIKVTIDDGKGGKRHLPLASIEKIAELRLRELLEIIKDELKEHKVLDRIGNKIILTGGGALLPDVAKLTREIFSNIPVEIGTPKVDMFLPEALNNPRFTTPIGLLLFARDNMDNFRQTSVRKQFKQDCRDFVKTLANAWRNLCNAINF